MSSWRISIVLNSGFNAGLLQIYCGVNADLMQIKCGFIVGLLWVYCGVNLWSIEAGQLRGDAS